MIPVKEFLNTDRSIYSKSWVPGPWTVLQWGLQQIGLAGTGSYEGTSGARKLKTSAFVLVEVLEKVAAQVLAAREKRGQSLTDRIVSREEFGQELGALGVAGVSDEDITILLRYLERDKQALSYNDNVSIAIHPIIAEPIELKSPADRQIQVLIVRCPRTNNVPRHRYRLPQVTSLQPEHAMHHALHPHHHPCRKSLILSQNRESCLGSLRPTIQEARGKESRATFRYAAQARRGVYTD